MTTTERDLLAGKPIWRGSFDRTKTDCITRRLVKVGCQPMECPVAVRPDHAKLHRCQAAGVWCCEQTCRRLHGVKA